jgi:hypothetical protein
MEIVLVGTALAAEPRLLDKGEQRLEVRLRLAGKADDERAPERYFFSDSFLSCEPAGKPGKVKPVNMLRAWLCI